MPLTDNTVLWFGAHKGKKLANVPASYLIWLSQQDWCDQGIVQYVQDNIQVLKKEIKK